MPEFMEKVKDSLLRKSTVQSEASQKHIIVHNHITCDECGKKNIEGVLIESFLNKNLLVLSNFSHQNFFKAKNSTIGSMKNTNFLD